MKILRVFVNVVFALVTFLSISAASTPQPKQEGLFVDAGRAGSLPLAADPSTSQTRYVEVNLDMLARTGVGDELYLNLYDDAIFTAVIERVQETYSGSYAWTGYLKGVEYSQVVLVASIEQLAGNVTMPGVFYQVRYAGNGVHAITTIDQSAFPPEAEPIPVDLSGDVWTSEHDSPTADDGSAIDVLVVYTPATRSAVGGTAAVQNLIDLAIVETNQSYTNSGIFQRLNLVHTAEVAYTESGNMNTDLTRLTSSTDGYMDNVHSLRNAYNADTVSMIVESTQYCGIAWLMANVNPTFESHAFSIVASQCATGYYSFGHELGHNMGARHDWYVDDVLNSPYSYNKGYVNVPDQWRTIMAYNSECSDHGFNCTRLQYWSNPNVRYGGDPMGVSIGTSTVCRAGDLGHPPCDADNRQTLNNTAYTVANFRVSSSGVVGPLVYEDHSVDDDNSGQSIGDGDGVLECGENIELYVVLRNTGTETASGASAVISTDSPYVVGPVDNTSSGYPDINSGGTATNTDGFDFEIATDAPDGHIITFDLEISASDGDSWTDSFVISVTCASRYFLPLIINDPDV